MRTVDLIDKKKRGKNLSKKEIDFLLDGYIQGKVEDYQMSAFLMAVYFNGMSDEELLNFTINMKNSGEIIKLKSSKKFLVDKHSTGGVGDKITIILSPILASLGMGTAKLSGKGLGHTGGTIDKFESLNNFKFSQNNKELLNILNSTGIGLMGYSEKVVPLDKKIYSLRDVTATVDSIPLIASSIMSKKLAVESDIIVLDVKAGDGAFMKNISQAEELSKRMVNIGKNYGRKTIAIISEMDEPLGYNIGNSLEIIESIDSLNGNFSDDIKEVVYEIIYQILLFRKKVTSYSEAKDIIDKLIESKKPLKLLQKFLNLSGVEYNVTENVNLIKIADNKLKIISNKEGYINKISAKKIGEAAMIIGAGRSKKDDKIDYSVGIKLHKKVLDYVKKGEILAEIYYNDNAKLSESKILVEEAFLIEDFKKNSIKKTIIKVIQ